MLKLIFNLLKMLLGNKFPKKKKEIIYELRDFRVGRTTLIKLKKII